MFLWGWLRSWKKPNRDFRSRKRWCAILWFIVRLLQKLCGYGTYIDLILKQWKINEFIERDEEAGSKCTFLNDPFPPVFTLLAVLANASVSLIQQIATRKKQSNRTVLLIIFSKGKNTAEDLRGQNLSMSIYRHLLYVIPYLYWRNHLSRRLYLRPL